MLKLLIRKHIVLVSINKFKLIRVVKAVGQLFNMLFVIVKR